MKIYADYKEFKTVDRAFRADFEKMSDKFISHFKDGLNFFHTEGITISRLLMICWIPPVLEDFSVIGLLTGRRRLLVMKS